MTNVIFTILGTVIGIFFGGFYWETTGAMICGSISGLIVGGANVLLDKPIPGRFNNPDENPKVKPKSIAPAELKG